MKLFHLAGAATNLIRKIYNHRSIIKTLAVREVQSRYAGTLGGTVWSVVNPFMMIGVYWFIFSVGFKVRPANGVPFIAVFLCGLVPWLLFSETLATNVVVIIRNPHLVTKTVFPTEILPLVSLAAGLITHGFMLLILVVVLLVSGIGLSVYNLQFLYYLFSLSVLIVGLSWFLSAINVFYRDIGQILGVALNLWFWLTPVVWVFDIIPEQLRFYFNFNPLLYIVEGYRYSFIYHLPFWQNYHSGIYFWLISLTSFAIGGLVFRKLKPDFPELL